jgi:hypothetical protein
MRSVLAVVIHDSGCFQGFLAWLATIMVLAKIKGEGLALSQQGRAIKSLIMACKDTTSAATDMNIMTAILLATNDLSRGNVDAAERNLNGINYLVKVRGGLHNLGMGGMLATAISNLDQFHAIFKDTMPTYNMSLRAITLDSPCYRPQLGRAFKDSLANPDPILDPQLVQAGVNFTRLLDIYEKGANNLASAAELTYFEYLQQVVEHQLTRVNARFHGTVTENECVCLAILLCNLIVCRNYGAIIPIHLTLASRLWRSVRLKHVYTRRPCDRWSGKLVMWLVIMSLSTAVDGRCPHASEALQLLRVARRESSVHSWEELKKTVLDYYVWSEVAQANLFQEIWQEVEVSDRSQPITDDTMDPTMAANWSTSEGNDPPSQGSPS